MMQTFVAGAGEGNTVLYREALLRVRCQSYKYIECVMCINLVQKL